MATYLSDAGIKRSKLLLGLHLRHALEAYEYFQRKNCMRSVHYRAIERFACVHVLIMLAEGVENAYAGLFSMTDCQRARWLSVTTEILLRQELPALIHQFDRMMIPFDTGLTANIVAELERFHSSRADADAIEQLIAC